MISVLVPLLSFHEDLEAEIVSRNVKKRREPTKIQFLLDGIFSTTHKRKKKKKLFTLLNGKMIISFYCSFGYDKKAANKKFNSRSMTSFQRIKRRSLCFAERKMVISFYCPFSYGQNIKKDTQTKDFTTIFWQSIEHHTTYEELTEKYANQETNSKLPTFLFLSHLN